MMENTLVTILPEQTIEDSDTFRQYHNKLLEKYDVDFTNNCDAWSLVTGNIYEQEGQFIAHITGIRYDEDGDWEGDLDGYLRLLEKDLIEYFEK